MSLKKSLFVAVLISAVSLGAFEFIGVSNL
ncbi:hypothetical protein C8C84_2664 [Flavobacterium sp. 102]|nr:hypothetical protein C8C84_2664 [Flavobacterium sp. 102]